MSGFKKMGLLPSGAIATAAAILFTSLLCLALTPLFLKGLLPLEAGGECAAAAAGIAVFAAVYLMSRLRGRQALPAAGIVVGGTVLIAALVCALAGRNCDFGPWLVRLAAFTAAGGLLGAVMSIQKRTLKRHRRRY